MKVIDERFMEDCVEECPEAFLGRKLRVLERQATLGGFRPDLICSDDSGLYIVEIQQRALDRVHLYKCLEYRDRLRENGKDKEVFVLVLCNTIDPKYLPVAKTHGVEIVAIERDRFIDIASTRCPGSVARLLKATDSSSNSKPRIITGYHFNPLGWSETFDIFDVISHFYSECGRNNVKLHQLREGGYWRVLHDIENLLCRDWKQSFRSILDPRMWNIDRLLHKPSEWEPEALSNIKRIRSPR